MNDHDHQPPAADSGAPVPHPRVVGGEAVRPWARAIDGNIDSSLEMSDEQIVRLERRLGRSIDV